MTEHRLAVVGSRGFQSRALVFEQLTALLSKVLEANQDLVIISGGARGVDSWAAEFAEEYKLECVEHLPNWDLHGKSAGFKRNHTIWNDATCGIAFWDGKSKGTEHSFKIAENQDKPLKVVVLHTYRIAKD